jgi:hypothetical protein
MVHGILAAAALTLLIYAALTVGIPTLALYAPGLRGTSLAELLDLLDPLW